MRAMSRALSNQEKTTQEMARRIHIRVRVFMDTNSQG